MHFCKDGLGMVWLDRLPLAAVGGSFVDGYAL